MECFDSSAVIPSVIWGCVAIYLISLFQQKAHMSTGLINDVTPPLLLSLVLAVIYAIVLYKFQDHSGATGIEGIPLVQFLKNTVCAVDDIFVGLSFALTGFAAWKYYKLWQQYR